MVEWNKEKRRWELSYCLPKRYMVAFHAVFNTQESRLITREVMEEVDAGVDKVIQAAYEQGVKDGIKQTS